MIFFWKEVLSTNRPRQTDYADYKINDQESEPNSKQPVLKTETSGNMILNGRPTAGTRDITQYILRTWI